MTAENQSEILSIIALVFGSAALVLAILTLIFLFRFRIRSGVPRDAMPVYDDFEQQAQAGLIGGKTKAWAYASTTHPSLTEWRPFWPAFCGIVLFTLLLVSIPLSIWATSSTRHIVHHNATHTW